MFYVKTSDNVKIAVYDYNSKGLRTVLMIHGWPLSNKIYEYQIRPLIACGCRVVTMDLRGFGSSDAPSYGYEYDRMAQDVYQVVSAMGLNKFTLVGFSMGGAIALRYMNKCRGAGVNKLVLLSAAAPCWTRRPNFPYGQTRESANDLIRQASTDRPSLTYTFSHKQLFASPQSEQIKDWFNDIALSASGIGTVQAAISLRDEDGRADLSVVHVPTFIIYGLKDVVVPSDLIMIQHDSIKNSKLFTLENSGHGIMYDELEAFNQLFLSVV